MEQAIALLRARVDEEFRIAERLDSKRRQGFALAAGFYGLVQAIAWGSSFAEAAVTDRERVVLGLFALMGALAVGVVGALTIKGEGVLPEADLAPDAVGRWLNHPEGLLYVHRKIVRGLITVAKARHASNERRQKGLVAAKWAAGGAFLVAGAQLLLAIFIRIN